ncbi:hypothetical protein [Streptomyces sp. NPDC005731]|uniref:hypothetical protein n=1 Tax=Streptomyces sp. NPDC005731 TaxID=3157056 RepID=UPI0033C8AF03
MRLTKRTAGAAGIVGAIVFASMAITAPASYAGSSCTPVLGWCSGTANDTNLGATAFRNWCGDQGNMTMITTKPTTCTSDGVSQSFINVAAGSRTPSNQDWDGFQVDAGWCYTVKFVRHGQTDVTKTYNRIGASAGYVKVDNSSTAHITRQGTASC